VLLQKDQILRTEWNFHMGEWRRSVERLKDMFALLFPRIGDDAPLPPRPAAPSAQPAIGSVNSAVSGVGSAGSHDEDGDDAVDWLDAEEDGDEVGGVEQSDRSGDAAWAPGHESAGNAPFTLVSNTHQLHSSSARELVFTMLLFYWAC
jgi:hypothetical protein